MIVTMYENSLALIKWFVNGLAGKTVSTAASEQDLVVEDLSQAAASEQDLVVEDLGQAAASEQDLVVGYHHGWKYEIAPKKRNVAPKNTHQIQY